MLVASKGPAQIIPVHITSHHHHHQDGLEVKLLRRQRRRILNFPHDAHGSLLSTPLSSSALSSSFCNHGCHHHLHHISHHHRHQHLHNLHQCIMVCSPEPAPSRRSSSSSRRCLASSRLRPRPEQDLPQVGLLNLAGGKPSPSLPNTKKGSSPLFSQLLRKLPSSHSSGFLLLTQRLFLEKIFFYYFSQIQFSKLY